MMRVSGHRAAIATKRLWQTAILTAAGAIGVTFHAQAALYYWSDSEPGVSRSDPAALPRRPKARHQAEKKTEALQKEPAKPQGPLIISISIDQQKLRLYDANGLYAESPVSTGMRGHATPMGVFSVIQKQKLHHSNIYSGAPMPFMQRITWSGIAIHAGVLPGYPASHGCIRMPMAFAMKMWNWTKMGARVVVTPGEITPASFSHPLLAALKVAPQPMAADEPKSDAPIAAKADKAADVDVKTQPASVEAAVELRSTIGHGDGVKPLMDEPMASAPCTRADPHRGCQRHCSGWRMPRSRCPTLRQPVATHSRRPSNAFPLGPATHPWMMRSLVKSPRPTTGRPRPNRPQPAVKVDASASESIKVDEPKVEAKAADVKAAEVKAEAPKADAAKPSEKPDEGSMTATVPAAVPPATKDQDRLTGVEKAAASKSDPLTASPKRSGQIAVFVSRKDSKLYVRQNFAPLFDVPVTIAPSDRPLGTHVFTAQADKNDANVLHWSVVSLPVPRVAQRNDEDERASRRRKIAGAVDVKPLPAPDSPAEALDRLSLPADALARIAEALSTGGSIIVSDQGIAAGETGEGTDFIVSLR